jgi:transposase
VAAPRYDRDALLATPGVELIPPRRRNRTKPKTQDARPLRRYKRHWKVERLNAWLQNYRRVLVPQEYHVENYLGFVYLACMHILVRRL